VRAEHVVAGVAFVEHPEVVRQFVRFSIVGVVGFGVDTAILYALVGAFALNLYTARVGSFLGAASVTWALNRAWTFRQSAVPAAHRQWLAFVAVNSVGALINYSAYAVLIGTVPLTQRWPVIAIGVGSLSGLTFNFLLSRLVVFKRPQA